MKHTPKIFSIILSSLALFSMAFSAVPAALPVPITRDSASISLASNSNHLDVQSISNFTSAVSNGNSGQLTGVYIADTFGDKVVQQPSGNAAYVSTTANTLTQFSLASQYGSTGILAHNNLAGQSFSQLYSGEVITLVYGDGSTRNYTVSAIREYQALSPYSAYSKFVDLNNPSRVLTSTDLFLETFGLNGALVLQTCIAKNGSSSWGRLFIIAYPS